MAQRRPDQPARATSCSPSKRLEEAELEAWEGLREKVEEGMASGPPIPATEKFWRDFRAELSSR